MMKLLIQMKKFISSEYFPVLCCFIILVAGFVTVRMKGIEQDYAYNKIYENLKKEKIINKEKKAQKADSLSVSNLQMLAKKYKLSLPTEDQIIVIK